MAGAEASTENARPVSTQERVRLLDALRGFAILGILLANMLLFSGYFFLSSESVAQLGTATADHIAVFLIDVLVDGKFYSLFSFLFGVGFAIQLIYALSLFSCEHQDPIIFGHFQTLESRIEAC